MYCSFFEKGDSCCIEGLNDLSYRIPVLYRLFPPTLKFPFNRECGLLGDGNHGDVPMRALSLYCKTHIGWSG